MPALKKVACIVNTTKEQAISIAQIISDICKSEGVITKITTEFPIPDGFLQDQDTCCVIGGDGTLLSVVQQATQYQVPVISVNLGKLGFLTTLSHEEIYSKLPSILRGEYIISHRSTLECTNADGTTSRALNDIVIKHSSVAKLASLEVHINNEHITQYYCDGVIFCTPTGSTAYNLSAGGPIVAPQAKVFAMTPICPHKFTNRTVVFDDTTHIRVFNINPESILSIGIDGNLAFKAVSSFPLKIKVSSQSIPLVLLPDYSYFKMLSMKLNWS